MAGRGRQVLNRKVLGGVATLRRNLLLRPERVSKLGEGAAVGGA